MDRVRYWGPRVAGKHWGPISAGLTVAELMAEDAYDRVNKWAIERGLKRKRGRRDPIPPRLKQDQLRLPALEANSNNKMSRSRGRSVSRSQRMRSRSRSVVNYLDNPRRKSRRRLGTEGKYTGSFPFPNKKVKAKKDVVAKKGSRGVTVANIDAVTAGHVAYVGFSSLVRKVGDDSTLAGAPNRFVSSGMYHVAVCLLRKLFKQKCGIEWTRHDEILKVHVAGGMYQRGNIVVISRRDYAGAGTTGGSIIPTWHTYDIGWTADDSLAVLADKLAVELTNNDYGARNIQNTYRPTFYGLALALDSSQGVNYDDIQGVMRCDNMYVSVNTTQVIHVQNQTTSDANSLSTDVIDANPIKGRIFYFKDPAPEVRATGSWLSVLAGNENKLMHDVNADGVIYPDTSLGSESGQQAYGPWNTVPTGDEFKNCSRYSSVSLAPGEMKKIVLKFQFDGTVQKFLEGQALVSSALVEGTTGTNPSKYQFVNSRAALGTSILFAFEKRLSTGTSNVEIAVQRKLYVSAYIKKRVPNTLQCATVSERALPADDTTVGPPV